jgi:hypothetical protein
MANEADVRHGMVEDVDVPRNTPPHTEREKREHTHTNTCMGAIENLACLNAWRLSMYVRISIKTLPYADA